MNVKITIEIAENISICNSSFSAQTFNNIIHFSDVSQVIMELLKLVLLSCSLVFRHSKLSLCCRQPHTVRACD